MNEGRIFANPEHYKPDRVKSELKFLRDYFKFFFFMSYLAPPLQRELHQEAQHGLRDAPRDP